MTDLAVTRRHATARAGRDVVRPRVLDLLTRAALAGPVVEVVAPAGSGKSTAVNQWADARPDVQLLDGRTLDGAAPGTRGPAWLVVDDAHLAARADVAELVRDALAGTAAGVVLVGRSDLLIETQRLRVSGQLAQLRSTELAFTPREVRTLAAATVGPVDDEAARHVVGLTGGWPVAVRLALLAVVGDGEPGRALLRLGHDDLGADGYLVEQVLDHLTPRLRTFVLRATVDDVVDARLAEELVDGGAELLDECVRMRLFLDPVGRASAEQPQRYRWNPLVAARVRAIAERRQPATSPRLHRRAALHMARSVPEAAFEHAMRAADPDLARDLLVRQWPELVVAGRAALGAGLAVRLPAPADADPDVRLVRAVGVPGTGDGTGLAPVLVTMARTVPAPARSAVREALRDATGLAPAAHLLVRYALARSAETPGTSAGDDVVEELLHVAAAAGAAGLPLLRAACLGEAALRRAGRGPSTDATTAAVTALHGVAELDGAAAVRAPLDLALGADAVWQLRLDQARLHLLRARGARPGPAHADERRAADALLGLLVALQGGACPVVPPTDGVGAGPWAPVLATLRAAVVGPEGAPAPVDGLHPTVREVADSWRDAVLAADRGRPARAHDLVETALDAAAPEQVLLPLLPGRPRARDLLAAHLAWGTRHADLVQRVLATASPDEGAPADRLTARESEVLACLRAGMSSTEIAEALVVSVNTVKTHQRGLYRKLGVADRRDAVRQGLARGLLV